MEDLGASPGEDLWRAHLLPKSMGMTKSSMLCVRQTGKLKGSRYEVRREPLSYLFGNGSGSVKWGHEVLMTKAALLKDGRTDSKHGAISKHIPEDFKIDASSHVWSVLNNYE